ncbi:MAG: AAA family ATPase [Chloroflexi bacterium]|nr:AAA family ATPase [Chloroflexota bacterium]
MMDDVFERNGMGYLADFQSEQIRFFVDRIRRGRDGLTAELLVQTTIPTLGPHIHWARLNLSSTTARATFAKACNRRTESANIDWDGLVEMVCRKVAVSERQGQPFTTVGRRANIIGGNWLVENFLYRGEATTVFGDGGAGKSRFCLAIVLSIQSGEEVIPGFAPLKGGPVLYLDWESSPDRLDARVKALCRGAGLETIDIAYRGCTEPLQDQVEEIARYCQSEGIVAIVVDSVEMAMAGTKEIGGDANDSTIKMFAALRMIGCSALLVDHVAKNGDVAPGSPRRAYGSIFKGNLARMAFELRLGRDGINREGELHIGLFHEKRNDDGHLLKPAGFRVAFDDTETAYYREDIETSDLVARLSLMAQVQRELAKGTANLDILASALGITEKGKIRNLAVALHREKRNGRLVLIGDQWGLAFKGTHAGGA